MASVRHPPTEIAKTPGERPSQRRGPPSKSSGLAYSRETRAWGNPRLCFSAIRAARDISGIGPVEANPLGPGSGTGQF